MHVDWTPTDKWTGSGRYMSMWSVFSTMYIVMMNTSQINEGLPLEDWCQHGVVINAEHSSPFSVHCERKMLEKDLAYN